MAAQNTDQQAERVSSRSWTTRRDEKQRRLRLVSSWMKGPLLPRDKLVESLQLLIAPGDRVVLEGDNQKQADFLSRSLVRVDPARARSLYAVQGPGADALATAKTSKAAWRVKPSFYQVSTEDRTINPELERFLAKRMKATTIELASGHLSLVSHPREIADLILAAAGHRG